MADDPGQIGQNEIEELLKQAKVDAPQSSTPAASESSALGAVGQDEIDALLNNIGGSSSAADAQQPAAVAATATQRVPDSQKYASEPASTDPGGDIDFLLGQAEEAIASVNRPSEAAEGLAEFQFKDFTGSSPSEEKATLDLLRDVELDLKIELGRTNMYLEEVLKLRRGSVVSLDKLAGDPVDVYVNGRLIARGEVLVLNDNFCVRVAELISGDDH